MHALIIREPWIGLILAGRKTWEMRSSGTQIRGRIGLIRKGSGLVVGVADLVESLPPLDAAQFADARNRHQVPPENEADALGGGWVHPWVLADARALPRPVPAGQKPGQVIWVPLSPAVAAEIDDQIGPSTCAVSQSHAVSEASAATIAQKPIAKASVPGAASSSRRSATSQEITVELTDGAIRNANLSVRKALHMLPDDVLGGTNRDLAARGRLTVVFEPGETVETDIPTDKMTLRCRGAVADFFARTGVKGGDVVRMSFDRAGALRVRVASRCQV